MSGFDFCASSFSLVASCHSLFKVRGTGGAEGREAKKGREVEEGVKGRIGRRGGEAKMRGGGSAAIDGQRMASACTQRDVQLATRMAKTMPKARTMQPATPDQTWTWSLAGWPVWPYARK